MCFDRIRVNFKRPILDDNGLKDSRQDTGKTPGFAILPLPLTDAAFTSGKILFHFDPFAWLKFSLPPSFSFSSVSTSGKSGRFGFHFDPDTSFLTEAAGSENLREMLLEDIELEVLLEDTELEVLFEDRSSCLEVATPDFAFPVLASSGQIDPRLVTKNDQTMYDGS